jgi:hypothetical protein
LLKLVVVTVDIAYYVIHESSFVNYSEVIA